MTGKDIATKTIRQNNWGVMGLSYMPGNVCIISDYRLQKHGRSAEQIRAKLLKVALHELGHTAGLPHCKQPKCLMTDAEGKDKLDEQKQYCYSCRTILFGP
jgi:archaemetzincin